MTTAERITFVVPGAPKPHPRPRAFARGGHARMYTPRPAQDRKYLIQTYARTIYGNHPPHDGPVSMEVEFIMPRPQSLVWKTKPMRQEKLSHGPDLDNLAKGVMDALNGVLYKDDRQIYQLTVRKWTASGDEAPRIIITVELE